MIKAEILAHSKNEFGNEIATIKCTFPRIILAELNTHRMFSRNSASSRAIPFEKMVESVMNNPFIPIAWQANHKGMQGTEYVSERDKEVAISTWLVGRNKAVEQAKHLAERNVTKQLANRMLEPYMWHTCIITATEWENFFALRCPQYVRPHGKGETIYRSRKDFTKTWVENTGDPSPLKWSYLEFAQYNKGQAEIHMMALAEAIWDVLNESKPRELKDGEWHIPYGDKIDNHKLMDQLMPDLAIGESWDIDFHKVKISTVMCARVSYTTLDSEQSEWTYEKYIQKHDELKNANPIHASPFEHCARAMSESEYVLNIKSECQSIDAEPEGISERDGYTFNNLALRDEELGWSGNFRGFVQYRKMIPNENITK